MPEISQALDSLLAELRFNDVCVCEPKPRVLPSVPPNDPPQIVTQFCSPPPPPSGYTSRSSRPPANSQSRHSPVKSCPLCLQAGRVSNHYLSDCTYLPQQDRRYNGQSTTGSPHFWLHGWWPHRWWRLPYHQWMSSPSCSEGATPPPTTFDPSPSRRFQIRQSPYFDVFYEHQIVRITIDSGATGNMIRASTAKAIGWINITDSIQSAHQADGSSLLDVIGETRLTFTINENQFTFVGLVVENLDVEVLVGTPFMKHNDIAIRPARRQITLSDGTVYSYGSTPVLTCPKLYVVHMCCAHPRR